MLLDELTARTLLDVLPQAALVIDGDGGIVDGNHAAGVLLATRSIPRSQSILRYLPEEERVRLDPLAWLRRWADHPDAPELRHVHLICRDEHGREKPVRVQVGSLPGDHRLYVVLLYDVSEEQAQRQRVRDAHRLAARLLAMSADGIVNVDERLEITYANGSAERLFDYPRGTLIGKPLSVLLPERFHRNHERVIGAFMESPQAARLMGQRGEIVGMTRGGDEIPLEASITKVTLGQQRVLSAHLRDLRPRHAAEGALARSEARFRIAFDHAFQAMALIAPDGRVLEMNHAARRLLPEWVDPVGQPFAWLPFWSGDPAGTASTLERAITGCLVGRPFQTTAKVKSRDGVEQILDLTLSPVTTDEAAFAVLAEAHYVNDAAG